jgi:DNA-binding transcriptional MerR regulator
VQKIYMISDLASATGLSRHTLNFYLKIGLIEESGRTESNYRFFEQAVVDRLNRIIELRSKGHSLQQIKTLLEDGRP